MPKELVEFLESVPDPRRTNGGNIVYELKDILLLELMGRMSQCVTRKDVIEFGKGNLPALRRMGILQHGVPSEPTLCRISQKIDSQAFADRLNEFVAKYMLVTKDDGMEIVAVDGKYANGTTLENGRSPDIVSAHSVNSNMTVCTEMCDAKSNEITTDPKVIDKAAHDGVIVTLDAMGCQKDIVDKIREKNAHFLIEVKANQKQLRWSIEDRVKDAPVVDMFRSEPELQGGRIETRICRTYRGTDVMVDKDKWGAGLTVVEIETRTIKKSTKVETTYKYLYISDMDVPAARFADIARKHWRVEVTHWHLDRNLKQDDIKRKTKGAAMYLDTLQRLCLNLFSKWRSNRKKIVDRGRGNAELIRRCRNHFTFLKEVLTLK